MIGGTGDDTYIVDNAGDAVTENAGQGADTVLASVTYTLTAGADVEVLATTNDAVISAIQLTGNSSGNVIRGNNGGNFLNGGGGDDQLIGLGGDDAYYVDSMSDIVTENAGQGADVVYTTVSYALTPGADVEVLAVEFWFGSDPIDLTGNASGNYVGGNWGNNVINGGDGNDTLEGFFGQDAFLFNTPLNSASNMDVILDFGAAEDTMRLDDAIFTSLSPGTLAGSEFVIGSAALDGNDFIIYDDTTGAVLYDSDGSGAASPFQIALLDPGLAMTNFNFFVV